MDTFAFKLLTFLHILSVIVAFAPAFVWPVVTGKLKRVHGPDAIDRRAPPGPGSPPWLSGRAARS